MAAYGWIVRKFVRNGEIVPDHFTGSTPQAMTVGTTLPLLSYEASAICSAEIQVPNNVGVAATTFTVTVPYKIRVLSSSRFVKSAVAVGAGNVTVALGKSAPIAGATNISSTTAASLAANAVGTITSHVVTAETVNPFAADAESLTITVTKVNAGDNGAGTVYLNFVRAD